MEKYTRIDKVKFNDGYETYLLTSMDYSDGRMFEVDLKSEMYFVCDYEVVERMNMCFIHELKDVFKFCLINGIRIEEERLGEDFILVGGGTDNIVTNDLKRVCIGDLLDYVNDTDNKTIANLVLDYVKELRG